MESAQDGAAGLSSSFQMRVSIRASAPWGILAMPILVVVLGLPSLPSLFRGNALGLAFQLVPILLIVGMGVHICLGARRWKPGVASFEQESLVLRSQLAKTPQWQTLVIYAACGVVLGTSLFGSGLQNLAISAAIAFPILFVVVRANYFVRRSITPGEFRFAKADTECKLLDNARVRLKTMVRVPKVGASKMNLDLTFENPPDVEIFCRELKSPDLASGDGKTAPL